MKTVWLDCGDRETWLKKRSKYITSTDLAVLFGLDTRKTVTQLWHEKKNGVIDRIPTTEAMEWGAELEEAIGRKVARDHGWNVRFMRNVLAIIPELRFAASLDFWASAPWAGPCEVKLVSEGAWKMGGWIGGKRGFRAPARIELQVQGQLLATRAEEAYISVLRGGMWSAVDRRVPEVSTQRALVSRLRSWSRLLEGDTPPDVYNIPLAVGS